jgi:hypothetical protein
VVQNQFDKEKQMIHEGNRFNEGHHTAQEALVERISSTDHGQLLFGLAEYLEEGDDTLAGIAERFHDNDIYEIAGQTAGITVVISGRKYEIQVKEV